MVSEIQFDPMIVVFAKQPVAGKVKTRLAKKTGSDNALKVYNYLLNHTKDTVSDSGFDYVMHYDNLQKGSSLGERLSHAFDLYKNNCAVIFIGTDFPFITIELIIKAVDRLKLNDVVIGPSLDGGYYLIGLKEKRDLFEGIDWSTENVLEQTIAKVSNHKYYLLPEYYDIDTFNDLKKYVADYPESGLAVVAGQFL
ncbi:MAG: glycosyltransferase [bacterium]|nr:glycosyltransferase [bacterium]